MLHSSSMYLNIKSSVTLTQHHVLRSIPCNLMM